MRVLVLFGPTASGKGAVARALAARLGGEIVCMDALKVYRRMDVGTAKPSAVDRAAVPHHVLDVVEPWEQYDVGRWTRDVAAAVDGIASRGRVAILVGGTGLYLRAVVRGLAETPPRDRSVRAELEAAVVSRGAPALHADLAAVDPPTAARLHPNDAKRIVRALEVHRVSDRTLTAWHAETRPTFPGAQVFACVRDPADLRARIAARTAKMLAAGLVDEVRALKADPHGLAREPAASVGYAEILDFLDGRRTLPSAVEELERRTWRLTGRQRAWAKSVPDRVDLAVPPDQPPTETAGRIHAALA